MPYDHGGECRKSCFLCASPVACFSGRRRLWRWRRKQRRGKLLWRRLLSVVVDVFVSQDEQFWNAAMYGNQKNGWGGWSLPGDDQKRCAVSFIMHRNQFRAALLTGRLRVVHSVFVKE